MKWNGHHKIYDSRRIQCIGKVIFKIKKQKKWNSFKIKIKEQNKWNSFNINIKKQTNDKIHSFQNCVQLELGFVLSKMFYQIFDQNRQINWLGPDINILT